MTTKSQDESKNSTSQWIPVMTESVRYIVLPFLSVEQKVCRPHEGSWRTGRGGRPVCGSSFFLFLTDMELISGVRFENPGEGLTTGPYISSILICSDCVCGWFKVTRIHPDPSPAKQRMCSKNIRASKVSVVSKSGTWSSWHLLRNIYKAHPHGLLKLLHGSNKAIAGFYISRKALELLYLIIAT